MNPYTPLRLRLEQISRQLASIPGDFDDLHAKIIAAWNEISDRERALDEAPIQSIAYAGARPYDMTIKVGQIEDEARVIFASAPAGVPLAGAEDAPAGPVYSNPWRAGVEGFMGSAGSGLKIVIALLVVLVIASFMKR